MKKKDEKDKIVIGIIILSILLVILLIISFILSPEKEEDNSNISVGSFNSDDRENIIEKLKDMKERDRIEFYFNTFFNYIENNEYEDAYGILNEEFKKNYFPNLSDFEEYCSKNFTDMMNISQDNIERNGNIYVLWISLSDVINDRKDSKKEMNIVVKENDFYDFEISFSVN